MKLSRQSLAALKALVDTGELRFHPAQQRHQLGTWKAAGYSEGFAGRAVGMLVKVGLAIRSGDVVRPGRDARTTLRRPQAGPRQALPAHVADALRVMVKHGRLLWCAERKLWETPLPIEWSGYETVSAKAMAELARQVFVTVTPKMVAEITPHGETAAELHGIARRVRA